MQYPLTKVHPNDTDPEFRCVVVKPVLRYLEAELGLEKMEQVVTSTQMNRDYLENGNNWISFDYYCRLLDELVNATGNPMAPFIAARDHSNRRSYSTIESFLTRWATPGSTYRFLAQFYTLWSRVAPWELVEITSGRCVFKLTFPEGKQNRNNCLAIQGSLAAVPVFFGLPFAEVVHKECMCDGAEGCFFEVKWINKPRAKTAWQGSLLGMLAGLIATVLLKGPPGWPLIVGGLMLAGYYMGRTSDYITRLSKVYQSSEDQSRALLKTMVSMQELNRNLQGEVKKRTQELSTSNEALQQALKDLTITQKRTMQIERQAAIGALAAGTAHEMNSPLNSIRLSIQALKEDGVSDPALLRIIENADRASLRCCRIVKELLSFSRSPQQLAQYSLADIVNDAVQIFLSETPEHPKVEQVIPNNLPAMHLDRAQIQQAIMNLLSNANDAMHGNGTIAVTLKVVRREMHLTISDDGPGMDRETMARIFDPFYSTKATDRKGLGLGLSITHELISKNGGTIHVDSAPGSGTCFTIVFPLHLNTGEAMTNKDYEGAQRNEHRQ